jgi:hypothetical protein
LSGKEEFMSQSLPQPQRELSAAKRMRKPYTAPVLEDYGMVRELTHTSAPGFYNYADVATYYTSAIG